MSSLTDSAAFSETVLTGTGSRNLFDYIKDEQSTFSEKPLCAEDSILFTQLVYLHMGDYVKEFRKMPSLSVSLKKLSDPDVLKIMSRSVRIPEDTCRLLTLAASSRRFGRTKVKYFAEHTDLQAEKQFSAVTFLLDNHTAFVAFRGTDNTIVGWRENFNMAYHTPVPSQAESADYLNKVINRLRTRRIYVGGHSKGGNLAVYAAMHCGAKEQQRILGVYNLDGPGFKDDVTGSPEMQAIRGKLHNYLPHEAMIGTLLKSSGESTVVYSEGKGFDQHNPLNWIFTGNVLKKADSLSPDAIVFDRVLDNWMDTLSGAQRELLVNTMFEIIYNSGAKTFNDVLEMIQNGDISALRVIKNMDPQRRRQLIPLIKSLGIEYVKAKFSGRKKN